MVHLTSGEVIFILDTLESAKVEFEELEHAKEWFCTEVLDRIESALEILESKRT